LCERRINSSSGADVDPAGIFLDEHHPVGEPVCGPNDDLAVLDTRFEATNANLPGIEGEAGEREREHGVVAR
jgi:hypothetical protein